LSWILAALGYKYAIVMPLSALLAFVLTLIIVARGKGPMASAALLLIVPVPFVIGAFAAIEAGVFSFRVLATLATEARWDQVAHVISTLFVGPMVGMSLMAPSYILAILGSSFRSLSADPKVSSGSRD
jgi:hypothetical protein